MVHVARYRIVVLAACLEMTWCCTPIQGYEIARSIEYKVLEDGKKLLADVYLPDAKKDVPGDVSLQRLPTLLMIHGGAWFSGNKVHVSYHARHAASAGFAVVAINYRLAPRYKFPCQLEDCHDALAWIGAHAEEYGFDRERVGVYGYSAGAQLACLVGMAQDVARDQQPDVLPHNDILRQLRRPKDMPEIRAIVAGGAPCEFSWIPEDAQTLAYWLGSSRQENRYVYDAASPVVFVDPKDPPTFLFHGEADRIVPLTSPQKLAQRLSRFEVPHQLFVIEDASHMGAFLNPQARLKAIRFLDRHLSRPAQDP